MRNKVVTINSGGKLRASLTTNMQAAVDKRVKTMAVLRRIKAGNGLCKIVLVEGIGWGALTDIVYEFIDWGRANAYICGNRRAA